MYVLLFIFMSVRYTLALLWWTDSPWPLSGCRTGSINRHTWADFTMYTLLKLKIIKSKTTISTCRKLHYYDKIAISTHSKTKTIFIIYIHKLWSSVILDLKLLNCSFLCRHWQKSVQFGFEVVSIHFCKIRIHLSV